MGQRLSGLRKTRTARKGAQCLRALVGRKRAPATLPALPTELILAVAHYLPPSGYMSLSYSCRTIRNKMGASIAHVLGDKVPIGQHSESTLSIETRNIRFLERLDLQFMLDHDREMPSKAASFNYSSISRPALELARKERCCPSNAGLLWICPHRIYDYKEATASREISERHECESSPLFSNARFQGDFLIKIPIMRVPRDRVPSYEEVREALRPLEAPVCPHLRLNDVCGRNCWHADCRRSNLDPGWVDGIRCGCGLPHSLKETWYKSCNFCNAIIFFDSETEPNGPKTVTINIVRSIQGKSGCNDRAWVAQVAQPEDFEEYERAWQATYAECLRKVESFSHV